MKEAIGKDGKWHPWEELSKEERDEWIKAMDDADKIHDYYKTHERPLSCTQQLLRYEQDHRIC